MKIDIPKYQEYANAIGQALSTEYDISGKTKAQLKEFATSIGLSVKTTLTKTVMLETILDSNEFKVYTLEENEKARREAEKAFYEKYPNGYSA